MNSVKKSGQLLFLILLVSQYCFGQTANADICKTTSQVIGDLKTLHIAPPAFDQKVYSEVIELFIEDIDSRGLFFLAQDEEDFKKAIDLNSSNWACRFIAMTTSVFKKRMMFSDSIVSKALSADGKYSISDSIEFALKKTHLELAASEKELAAYLEKRIRFYKLLNQYDFINDSLYKVRDVAGVRKLVTRQYEKNKPGVKTDAELERYVAEKFWNALAMRCDPHSNYFNTETKNQFEEDVSTTEFSFGIITTENEDGEIEIIKIIPGSPAWKSNKLNEGDIITRASFNKLKDADVAYADSDEFNSQLESQNNKELSLEIKKKNGNMAHTTINKTKITSSENNCDGYILEGIHNKFGYISLPAFYTDYENFTGLGCANDVAKEILKLKQENIEGLILDLRNNGGGSLTEAIDLAGIFINDGAVGVVSVVNDKPRIIKDLNRGTVYDGPLLVLINQLSASASEFLTATLQDYKRAIIVGQPTFGKATGQYITPVDTNIGINDPQKNGMGYLKLTGMKLYRISGSTHQGDGVKPDVKIPDILMNVKLYKESNEPFFLEPDVVNKKVMYQTLTQIPSADLQQMSDKRRANSQVFKTIETTASNIDDLFSKNYTFSISLSGIKKYFKWRDDFDAELQKVNKYQCNAFKVSNNNYLSNLISKTPDLYPDNNLVLENLQKDPILEEAFLILKDYCLITLKK